MLTEVDMERIMAAKRKLFEAIAPASDEAIDDYELLFEDAEYPQAGSETNAPLWQVSQNEKRPAVTLPAPQL